MTAKDASASRWRADGYDAVERATRIPMLLLSVAVVPLVAFSLVRHRLGPGTQTFLDAADATIWALFAVEYLTLLVLAPHRWVYARTHLLELSMVVLPFLRPLRLVRSGRVLRLVRIGRIGVAAAESAKIARHRLSGSALIFAATVAGIVVCAAAAAVLDAEQNATGSNIHNLGDALWWAIVTVTTVGYGDHYPVTATGKALATVLMLVGISLIGVVTAAIAAWFVKEATDADDKAELRSLRVEVAELSALVRTLHPDIRERSESRR